MSDQDGTTGLFIAIGKQVKLLRERKGLTQKEFGVKAGYSPDAISAMERGVRSPQPEMLEKAEEFLDAGGLFREVIPEVREAIATGRTRHPEWYRDYAGMEAKAVELHFYASHAMQGLLQTEDHARTVFAKRRPLLDEEMIEKRVTDRLSRQQIFERVPAPIVSYVLEEVILDRPTGGRRIHADQLRRLLHVGQMRNVEIQVMPTAQEEHPNMEGAFNLVTPKGYGQVAYTEIQGYPHLITDPEEVRKIADRYGIMRAMALRPAESRKLIEKKLEEL